MRILVLFIALLFFQAPAIAQDSGEAATQKPSNAFRSTTYPLPRFVTLRSNEVYVRSGPGRKYPVKWVFKKKGLPVEITLEYDAWRKIKDFDGDEGWVHKTLLSGKRSAFIHSEDLIPIHKKPKESSGILAHLEPKVLVEVEKCVEEWCAVNATGYKGWTQKNTLWGVYEDEIFD